MRILEDRHLQTIEGIIGRPLAREETAEVDGLDLLPAVALEVARKIAAESRPLAVMYLRELTPGTRLSSVLAFLEKIEVKKS